MSISIPFPLFFRFLLSGVLLGGSILSSGTPVFAITPGDMAGNSGNVQFNPAGATSNIAIDGNRAAIDWHQFNIGAGETANFNFNVSGGAVMNRVIGLSPSQIQGMLNSNGSVYLVNPNGIVVGSNARINTAGAFVGSTLNVTDAQKDRFLNGNSVTFERDRAAATFENNGEITASLGNVVLIGSRVVNTGTINAPQGAVELLAAQSVTATLADPARPYMTIHTTIDTVGGTGITQAGSINAVQARLEAVGGNVYALAINNSGTIRANGISTENGKIRLIANDGTIKNSGVITANANGANANAGKIELAAATIEMDAANVQALGNATSDSGISVNSTDNTKITSSVLATTDANIDIQSNGTITLDTKSGSAKSNSTLVNAYGAGNVTVKGKSVSLDSSIAGGRISLGSNSGQTTVITTNGDLNIQAHNGGSAQVGYQYHDTDARIAALGLTDIGKLYFPTGNISANVNGNLIINASYAQGNPEGLYRSPVAQIGHALFPSNVETIRGIDYHNIIRGDIDVVAQKDVQIISSGDSFSQIGHHVQGNIARDGDGNEFARAVQGNIKVDSYQDIIIKANNGSHSAIGQAGDHMMVLYSTVNGERIYPLITAIASRDTVIDAGNGSSAQIGNTILAHSSPMSGQMKNGIYTNIESISGRNLTMNGNAVIGHTNHVDPFYYNSIISVGYSMNRIKEVTQDSIRNSISGLTKDSLDLLANRFRGTEEGVLTMGSEARIGRELTNQIDGSNAVNYVGIFGWRMKKDNSTSAIQLADGAVLSGVKMNSNAPAGTYAGNDEYNLGAWPGKNDINTQYAFESYGYVLADYMAGNISSDLVPSTRGNMLPISVGKIHDTNLHIFYPGTPEPSLPPPPPHYEPPHWPIFPVWYEPLCCCCCCVTTCEEYIPGPCEKVRNACEPAGSESESEETPTLAPPQDQTNVPVTPSEIPSKPTTISLLF